MGIHERQDIAATTRHNRVQRGTTADDLLKWRCSLVLSVVHCAVCLVPLRLAALLPVSSLQQSPPPSPPPFAAAAAVAADTAAFLFAFPNTDAVEVYLSSERFWQVRCFGSKNSIKERNAKQSWLTLQVLGKGLPRRLRRLEPKSKSV